jgi:outer membrane protein OmpA-like peptidoglycan-associated protein
MSVCSRLSKGLVVGLLAVLAVSLVSSPAFAQSDSTPKWDVFMGYQWLHPGGTVPLPYGDPSNPQPFKIPDMAKGFAFSLAYNFDQHWAGEVNLGQSWGDGNNEGTVSIGPRYMWRTTDANYFIHGLVSLNHVNVQGLNSANGFDNNPKGFGIGAVLGGGMDLHLFKGLAWRVFEADYVWAKQNYSNFADPAFSSLRRPTFEGTRLATGLVLSWGGAPAVTPAASCSVQPSTVLVGEPITATVAASNFNPKHTVTYAWSSNGGQLTGKDTTAQIDTNNVAPGSYAVTAHVTDAKEKKNNEASCSATFTVKPLPPKNPPTLSISANPTSLMAGGTVSLSANCSSPDGVSVSVASWTASGGNISGSGTSATLNTAGASPGSISVGATCTDSRGLTAQATTQVMIENPPPPVDTALEARLALHSIYFVVNQPYISKPNGGLLPSQQKTLIALATDFKKYLETKPDAHLTLEGHADHRGSVEFNQALSQRRVASTKNFLVEQGVPAANIETKAFGKEDNLTSEQVIELVNSNPELTPEERARVLKNIVVIRMASNRRVDVTLSTTGQTSVRHFPFNSTDALTLIGGREADKKAAPAAKKPAPKKKP